MPTSTVERLEEIRAEAAAIIDLYEQREKLVVQVAHVLEMSVDDEIKSRISAVLPLVRALTEDPDSDATNDNVKLASEILMPVLAAKTKFDSFVENYIKRKPGEDRRRAALHCLHRIEYHSLHERQTRKRLRSNKQAGAGEEANFQPVPTASLLIGPYQANCRKTFITVTEGDSEKTVTFRHVIGKGLNVQWRLMALLSQPEYLNTFYSTAELATASGIPAVNVYNAIRALMEKIPEVAIQNPAGEFGIFAVKIVASGPP